MDVLVVGGSGFVGRHLVARLRDEGHSVEAWGRRASPFPGDVAWRSVDLVRDETLPAPPRGGWDATFQLAAHSIPDGVRGHVLTLENVAMTARVLDHLVDTSPASHAIVVSSARVYGPSRELHVEDEPLKPCGDYALSKQLCEIWAAARAPVLPVTVVRPFNLIGTGMPAGLLIPDLLERLRRGERRLRMRGRDATRDFLDVRDAVEAYVGLLSIPPTPGSQRTPVSSTPGPASSGAVFNLCSGRATRVSTLIGIMLDRLGLDVPIDFADASPDALVGDPGNLRAAIGWEPRRTIEDTIESILEARVG